MSEHLYKNPYKGLYTYTEKDSDIFYGRDDAIDKLRRLVYYNKLVTLYGKSGLGKSSLLQAGLFPLLRKNNFIPIYLRLKNFVKEESKPLAQYIVEEVLKEVGKTCEINKNIGDCSDEQVLKELFFGREFVNKDGTKIFPLIVLDQFEDMLIDYPFETSFLMRQLQILLDNNRITPDNYFPENDFRFILVIREDDLFRLEDCIDTHRLTKLKETRFRLKNLNEAESHNIILEPGKEIFTESDKQQIANKIVEKVKKNDENSELNTAILSLICDQLFHQIYIAKGRKISLDDVESFGNEEIETFYLNATKQFSHSQRKKLEDEILTNTGRRKIADYDDLKSSLGESLLKDLLEGEYRILYKIGKKNVELIHDLLAKVIFESRQKREAEEARKKEEEQNALKRKRISRMLFLQTLLLIAAALIIWAYWLVSPRTLDGAIRNTTIGPALHSYKVPSGELFLQENVIVKDHTFNSSHQIHTLRVGNNNTIGEIFSDDQHLKIILDGANNSIDGLWRFCNIDSVIITSNYRPTYIASWRDAFKESNYISFIIEGNNPYVIKLDDYTVIAKDESKENWQLLHIPYTRYPKMPLLLPDSIALDDTSLAQLKGRGYVLKPQLSAHMNNGVLYVDDKKVSLSDSLCWQITHISSNDTLVEMAMRFYFPNLKSVSFPNATTIKQNAFNGCTALTSISFPNATYIGKEAFRDCTALTSVSFPNATDIGMWAFDDCTALTAVSFPNATDIGQGAFEDCTALTSVSFPNATDIGAWAFSDCTALTSVSVPNATDIRIWAFSDCTALTAVSFPNATYVGELAFGDCTALTSVSFPNVTNIGRRVFFGCTALTSASFPNATDIGERAFSGCTALTSASFPNATDIGERAFYYNKALRSVEVGDDDIENDSFIGCNKITSFKINGTSIDIDSAMQRYAAGDGAYITHLTLNNNDTIPSGLKHGNVLESIRTFFSKEYYSYKNVLYDRADNVVLKAGLSDELFICNYDTVGFTNPNATIYTLNIAMMPREISRETIYVPYGKGEEYKHYNHPKEIHEMTFVETVYHHSLFAIAKHHNTIMLIVVLLALITMGFVIESIVKKKRIRKIGEYSGVIFCLMVLYVVMPFEYESLCYNLVVPRNVFYTFLLLPLGIVPMVMLVRYIQETIKRHKTKQKGSATKQ